MFPCFISLFQFALSGANLHSLPSLRDVLHLFPHTNDLDLFLDLHSNVSVFTFLIHFSKFKEASHNIFSLKVVLYPSNTKKSCIIGWYVCLVNNFSSSKIKFYMYQNSLLFLLPVYMSHYRPWIYCYRNKKLLNLTWINSKNKFRTCCRGLSICERFSINCVV